MQHYHIDYLDNICDFGEISPLQIGKKMGGIKTFSAVHTK